MVINTRSISRRCTFNIVSSPAIFALFPYVDLHIWKLSASISIFLFGCLSALHIYPFYNWGFLEFGAILHTIIPGISRDSLFAFWEKELFKYWHICRFYRCILFTLQNVCIVDFSSNIGLIFEILTLIDGRLTPYLYRETTLCLFCRFYILWKLTELFGSIAKL
jgi:hypothetical protein